MTCLRMKTWPECGEDIFVSNLISFEVDMGSFPPHIYIEHLFVSHRASLCHFRNLSECEELSVLKSAFVRMITTKQQLYQNTVLEDHAAAEISGRTRETSTNPLSAYLPLWTWFVTCHFSKVPIWVYVLSHDVQLRIFYTNAHWIHLLLHPLITQCFIYARCQQVIVLVWNSARMVREPSLTSFSLCLGQVLVSAAGQVHLHSLLASPQPELSSALQLPHHYSLHSLC